ncbi:MAG: response regulator [Holophagaceae bacterium]|nr:response regulator [Holophagaceae bacterium]
MKTVLVVDDQPEVVGLLQDILSLEGYRVLTADSSDPARKWLAIKKVDLAFLDVDMPGESGYELCEFIKGFPGAPKVVMLTGLEDEAHWQEGHRVGADVYAVKPFGRDRILMIVQELIGEAD